jgi:hypothetical protein
MKKIIMAVCLLMAGCAGVQLTPEMAKITSLNDPGGCKYITNCVITTQPHNMLRYLQYNTGVRGGDSYKVISSQPQSLLSRNDVVMTSFEIYKCR